MYVCTYVYPPQNDAGSYLGLYSAGGPFEVPVSFVTTQLDRKTLQFMESAEALDKVIESFKENYTGP